MAKRANVTILDSSVNRFYYVNELLAYVQFYKSKSTSDNLKKVILNFYKCNEIVAAKDLLWQLCKDYLGDKQGRRFTNTRSQLDADFSDIIIALKSIEENNKYVVPCT